MLTRERVTEKRVGMTDVLNTDQFNKNINNK